MNKKELIDKVANNLKQSDTHVKKADISVIIDATFEEIGKEIINGGKYLARGFGSFTSTTVKERKGKNPQTGKAILIPSRKRCKFTQSETLKEKINA